MKRADSFHNEKSISFQKVSQEGPQLKRSCYWLTPFLDLIMFLCSFTGFVFCYSDTSLGCCEFILFIYICSTLLSQSLVQRVKSMKTENQCRYSLCFSCCYLCTMVNSHNRPAQPKSHANRHQPGAINHTREITAMETGMNGDVYGCISPCAHRERLRAVKSNAGAFTEAQSKSVEHKKI